MSNEFVTKNVDVLWDSWLNSFKTLQKVQEDVEKKTVEALTAQQQLVGQTITAYSNLEEQSKQFSSNLQQNLKNSVTALPNQEYFTQWLDNVQEITEKTQSLLLNPNAVILDVVTSSQAQLDLTVKTALSQQKEKREETIAKIEELTEQLKESHKQLVGAK